MKHWFYRIPIYPAGLNTNRESREEIRKYYPTRPNTTETATQYTNILSFFGWEKPRTFPPMFFDPRMDKLTIEGTGLRLIGYSSDNEVRFKWTHRRYDIGAVAQDPKAGDLSLDFKRMTGIHHLEIWDLFEAVYQHDFIGLYRDGSWVRPFDNLDKLVVMGGSKGLETEADLEACKKLLKGHFELEMKYYPKTKMPEIIVRIPTQQERKEKRLRAIKFWTYKRT